MKVCFDVDGTLTNYSGFVNNTAIKYFKNKYNMEVINPNALELEDIFDIKNVLIKNGYSEQDAEIKTKEIVNKFWISYRYVKYSLLFPFRSGVKETIKKLQQDGFEVEVATSRAKTCENNMVGKVARKFTLWQFSINGIKIKKENIKFYPDDERKLEGLKQSNADIVFDDKRGIVNPVSQFANAICVNEKYNQDNLEPNITRINGFRNGEAINTIKKIVGEQEYDYLKRIKVSDKHYDIIIKSLLFFVLNRYKPIVLHRENLLDKSQRVIYSSNHRKTLDPIIIVATTKIGIHWAALKRFFDGKDSIFNNSKKPLLCNITSKGFKKLEFFPIDRKKDNPTASNSQAIKDMEIFLKLGEPVGIFGEGTTNKEIDKKDFNKFCDTFLRLANSSDAWVQPVTCLWLDDIKSKHKVIVNYGEPFKVKNMTIEDSMDYFMKIQNQSLNEIKELRNRIVENQVDQGRRIR